MDKDNFIRRFKNELRDLLSEDYDDAYATDIVETYWEREREFATPELCAQVEAGEHGKI